MTWEQLVKLAQRVPWVRLVVVVMLVLPVVLVILAYLDQLDPKAQQALRDLLRRLLPAKWLAPASGMATRLLASLPAIPPFSAGATR